jgi:hypothetical protein
VTSPFWPSFNLIFVLDFVFDFIRRLQALLHHEPTMFKFDFDIEDEDEQVQESFGTKAKPEVPQEHIAQVPFKAENLTDLVRSNICCHKSEIN